MLKLSFSPPNTTSNLQPMDQGIIQNFKVKYRKLFLTKLVGAIDKCNNVTEINKSITILDALYWAESAVSSISCVPNCFRKAGFPINIITENNYNSSELLPLFSKIVIEHVSASDYINIYIMLQ